MSDVVDFKVLEIERDSIQYAFVKLEFRSRMPQVSDLVEKKQEITKNFKGFI